jgi:hypothetical protein
MTCRRVGPGGSPVSAKALPLERWQAVQGPLHYRQPVQYNWKNVEHKLDNWAEFV